MNKHEIMIQCYNHNGFMETRALGGHDVPLNIVGLYCGVIRVLKLRAVSNAYIYVCIYDVAVLFIHLVS